MKDCNENGTCTVLEFPHQKKWHHVQERKPWNQFGFVGWSRLLLCFLTPPCLSCRANLSSRLWPVLLTLMDAFATGQGSCIFSKATCPWLLIAERTAGDKHEFSRVFNPSPGHTVTDMEKKHLAMMWSSVIPRRTRPDVGQGDFGDGKIIQIHQYHQNEVNFLLQILSDSFAPSPQDRSQLIRLHSWKLAIRTSWHQGFCLRSPSLPQKYLKIWGPAA